MALFQSAVLNKYLKQLAKARALQAEIDRADEEIDARGYPLYGLTEEEIRLVEGR
ncbi:MAG TPA: hypothetical protein PKD45_02615 [Flavobacteriales bacterium]|nr:hypothetical protein [Flavobacteriales bacterium]